MTGILIHKELISSVKKKKNRSLQGKGHCSNYAYVLRQRKRRAKNL